MIRISTHKAILASTAVGLGFLIFCGAGQAQTVTQQCSQKYQAAKTAKTLNGATWNQFRSQCAAELKGAAGTAPATTAPVAPAPAPAQAPVVTADPAPAPAAPAPAKPARARNKTAAPSIEPPATAPAEVGTAIFPTGISPQYASLKPGRARMKTCDDQYNANKPNNANGGLPWTVKGGGYYHECNERLKALTPTAAH